MSFNEILIETLVDNTTRLENSLNVIEGVNFSEYARPILSPRLDHDQLSLVFMTGCKKEFSNVHIGGDASFVLLYKNKPAFIMSYEIRIPELRIVQLQGTKAKGYIVNTTLDTTRFFADQTVNLLSDEDNTVFERVVMNPALCMQGVGNSYANENAINRYDQLRGMLRMKFDQSRKAFVLNLNNTYIQ